MACGLFQPKNILIGPPFFALQDIIGITPSSPLYICLAQTTSLALEILGSGSITLHVSAPSSTVDLVSSGKAKWKRRAHDRAILLCPDSAVSTSSPSGSSVEDRLHVVALPKAPVVGQQPPQLP